MHPELFESPDLDLLLQEILIQEQRARLTAETVLNDGVTRVVVPAVDRKIGERIAISLRPERIALHAEAKAANALPVAVADAVYHGDHLRLQLNAGPCSLVSKCGRQAAGWTPGSAGFACFQPEDCAVVA